MGEGSEGGRDSRPAREDAAHNPDQDRQTGTNTRSNDIPAPSEPAANSADSDVYQLYRRGVELLERGSAAAAAQLLERAAAAEPQSKSVLEALARAQFDAGWYQAAAGNFRRIVDASPADDYAQFGLGLALARTGDPGGAAEHLALAAAMRPNMRHYTDALRSVRATLSARSRMREDTSIDE
jgi:tetratricopeptide (TPR) repeat protein